MDNCDVLLPFGIAIVVIAGAFILVPYLRGKSDLLTAWNMMLLGVIIYPGLGSIETKYVPGFVWEHLNWFQPTAQEVRWYMQATAAFVITLIASYYLNTPAIRFSQKRLRNWPEVTAPMTFLIICVWLSITIASIIFVRLTFFGPFFSNLAWYGAPAGAVFTFYLWNRNRLNGALLALFIAVFLATAIYVMVVSGGRRLLVSLFVGPCICLYWSTFRYWKPSRTLTVMGLAGAATIAVSVVYSNFRYADSATGERRSAGWVIQQLSDLKKRQNIFQTLLENRLEYFAQSNGHFSLLTQRYVATGTLTPVSFNTLRFLATYPIPRRAWPNKPEPIGVKITRDAAKLPTTNWGIGIAGHGAYEGGIFVLMVYAVLLAAFMRFLDEPLRLQPNNPFLMYIHAAAMPNIIATTRGDLGVMTKEVAQCVLFAVILGVICRFVFGSAQRSARYSPAGSQSPNHRLGDFRGSRLQA